MWIAGVGVGAAIMVGGLAAVTHALLSAQAQEASALRDGVRDDMVREALWRMDGTMAPLLASESLRPPSDYEAFRSPSTAVNRLLQQVPQGEVLTPSPLLVATPEWIRMHFQFTPTAGVTSPQVPEGNWRDLAEGNYLKAGIEEARAAEFALLRKSLFADEAALVACTTAADAQQANSRAWQAMDSMEATAQQSSEPAQSDAGVDPPLTQTGQSAAGTKMSGRSPSRKQSSDERAMADLAARQQALNEAQTRAQTLEQLPAPTDAPAAKGAAASTTQVGPLVPVWVAGADPPLLVCIRRVVAADGWVIQGFVVDWSGLEPRLLARVTDLMEGCSLRPVVGGQAGFVPARMATLPVELNAGVVFAEQRIDGAPTDHGALVLAWTAGLGSILLAVAAAGAAIRFGERQARFASSVTHELRTPLTTFRLYSEMLRDGMVSDGARLKECHDTLVRESVRLSNLVESVLSLSRIERGVAPTPSSPRPMDAEDWRSLLRAIVAESAPGARSAVDVPEVLTPVAVDLETVSPIVANLASNAAKYGVSADGVADITVALRIDGHALVIRVLDAGPGIPRSRRQAIWRAFDRAGAESGPHAGIGLGLQLARALAERASGTLTLQDSPVGAAFELRLPVRVG